MIFLFKLKPGKLGTVPFKRLVTTSRDCFSGLICFVYKFRFSIFVCVQYTLHIGCLRCVDATRNDL